ncbi:3'(2'),5'-bisphosphate nucleotidase [Aliidiomarina minuta]|uniref:3'(2'),5'-bisphosphate nucleotidase CysQ n=1 Tax=Aliidiomarina minuta TaxID=880057 RepID=A0A432W9U1_9GAMM|nr:3'(2'),5'-bisphosphate nucleotidase CysQ [Aliidiomarina minuta]RUO26746.1 3'(2'),5'-bisphosphate nucleotidase [Aliidiomarina minuta]
MAVHTDRDELRRLQKEVAQIARQTGELVLDYYRSGDFSVDEKSDDTPVTSADLAASKFLSQALAALKPVLPVLSEEEIVPWTERRNWSRYWLIDPIDGTQEFIKGSGDFAISIALIDQHTPVLGAIYWPTEDTLYQAAEHLGASRVRLGQEQSIQVRQLRDPGRDELIVAISRRQPEQKILSRMNPQRSLKTLMTGSCSLKSCLVAEGSADCFLRVGPTGEWDTGAAQVIIEQAGGSLVSEHFEAVTYNRTASLGNPNFMVLGDPRIDWVSVFPGLV